ncbi:MAG: hypothetical protein V4729_09370 [Pseudomonadota bacterium]
MFKQSLALLGALSLSSLAQAEGLGLGAHGGLMGIGIDGYYRLSDKVVARGSYNTGDYDYDTTEEDVEFAATYTFDNAQLGVDWYPFAGGFRLSAAYVANGNELEMNAVPTGGTFTLNGVDYAAGDVGSMRATVSYPESAAYVGMGWGNPVGAGKGLGVTFDIGAYYLGEAEVAQTVSCGTFTLPGDCAQIREDAEAERQQLEEDLSDFPFWPQIQLGLTYQF